MSEPFLGEIKLISFNFPPRGWAFCNGSLFPINQNQALFSLLGTQYGGNGLTNFALPNLQGRIPVHAGSGFVVGQSGGEAAHILTPAELPAHTHDVRGSTAAGTLVSPAGARPAVSTAAAYSAAVNTTMGTGAVSSIGSSQAHENRPPFLALYFVIALQGVFPSRN